MKWSRVLLGGSLSGLVFNVGGLTAALLMGLPETFARFGVEPTTSTALLHVSLRFGLGFAAVLAYAGMRRGWGPGPSTALKVGILVWFVGYVPGSAVLHELGALSGGQLGFALIWGMAEAIVATLLGAWPYRGDVDD